MHLINIILFYIEEKGIVLLRSKIIMSKHTSWCNNWMKAAVVFLFVLFLCSLVLFLCSLVVCLFLFLCSLSLGCLFAYCFFVCFDCGWGKVKQHQRAGFVEQREHRPAGNNDPMFTYGQYR